jgi:DNA-binding NarL/FixJ family response regulator
MDNVPRLQAADEDSSLRLFLVDDHSLFRAGLKDVLDDEPGFEVVGESETGDCIDRIIESKTQLVLVDLRLPMLDGIDLCASIAAASDAHCIILTSHLASPDDLDRAAKAGACAYVLKGTDLNEFLDTIRSVAAGNNLLSPPAEVHRYS